MYLYSSRANPSSSSLLEGHGMVTYILPSSRLFHMIVCDSVDAHLFVVITRCMYVCVCIYIYDRIG